MRRRDFLAAMGSVPTVLAHPLVAAAQAPGGTPARLFSERVLANYAANLTFDKLPKDVVDAIKRVLIDTLGCAYGAAGAEPVKIAEETFRQSFAGKAVAHVIAGREPLSAEGAALVNGVMVRYLDLNDIYSGGDPAHPSECIPAAIACAEEAGSSGRDLITAIAAGYEAQLALVDAVGFGSRAFHSVSCAGFVTPLIAGKLWKMSAEQMANGMGISGPKQMTLLAINSGPISMVKALVFPSGAMEGIFAARLAKNGFTGAAGVLEYFVERTQGRTREWKLELGLDRFRILDVGLKRFPLQFELQTVAEAGVELRKDLKQDLSAISDIVVGVSARAKEATADPSRYEPKTKETADHSLPICLALALIDGDVTVAQFDAGRWKAPDVLALARKIRVEVPEGEGQRSGAAHVRVHLAGGRTLDKNVDVPDGAPKRPMSVETVSAKYLQFAEPVLGRDRAQKLLEMCLNLERVENIASLGSLLAR